MRPHALARSCTLALLMLTMLLLPGCLQVVRQEAPYYKKGPHQVEPPDGFFEPGTHVWVFDEKDSYHRVLSLGGTAAFIWRHDLTTVWEWREQQQQADKDE